MERQTIAKSTLIQILVDETTKALTGESYLLLAKQVRIRRRDGEPNWDAPSSGFRKPASSGATNPTSKEGRRRLSASYRPLSIHDKLLAASGPGWRDIRAGAYSSK
jgi:hypothetical protein